MTDDQSSLMEGFYSHFYNRDIVYLFSGGLFISILEYGLWEKIDLPGQLSLELIGFLAICYVVGLGLYTIIEDLIKLSKKLYQPPYDNKSFLIISQDLTDNYNKRVLNSFERLQYLAILGKTVGSASIFGTIIVCIVRFSNISLDNPILFAIILLIIGILMLCHGISMSKSIRTQEAILMDGIKIKKK